MKCTHALSIFSLLITSSTLHTSQALTRPKATDTSVPRSQALSNLLYETLDSMPRELIKIIVDYEPHFLRGEVEQKLIKHTQAIHCLIELPKTCQLACGTRNGKIQVWDIRTGNCNNTIKAHTDQINSLVLITPQRLASTAWDESLKIWHMPTCECIYVLSKTSHLHPAPSSRLCVPSLGQLAYISNDGPIIIWTLENGATKTINLPDSSSIHALIALPGNKIAVSTINLTKIFDSTTGNCLRIIKHPERICEPLFLAPHYFLAGELNGTISVWDINVGKQIYSILAHTRAVNHLQLLQDGRLASGSDDGTAKLWNLTDLKAIACNSTMVLPSKPVREQTAVRTEPTQLMSSPLNLVIQPLQNVAQVTALCLLNNGYLAVADARGKTTIFS